MLPLVCLVVLGDSSLVTTSGYVDSRTTAAQTLLNGAPGLTELAEANLQVKVKPLEQLTAFADVSLFWQGAWFVHGGERDQPEYRPSAVVSEVYLDAPLQDGFRLVLGKKRIVWGAGLAFNPTDVLNPPKDPTDPTFQRAGAWLAQAEWGFDKAALSLVLAGKATRQYAGLPTGLVWYPARPSAEAVRGWVPDDRDNEAHFAFAGRLYVLVADTDVNLLYSFTNLYNDAFADKSRLGLSLSHVFGSLELHTEASFYTGSARLEAEGHRVTRPFLDAEWLNARVVIGGRYQFNDSALFSFEYYFNGEGHSKPAFERLATLARANPTALLQAIAGSADPGTPQKFSFEPLRRHYAVLQYSKPQIFDDFTVSVAALVSLEDLSMQLVPQVTWAPKEWLQLTVAVYVPLSGVTAWGVRIGEATYGEFTLSPYGTRTLVQARVFF